MGVRRFSDLKIANREPGTGNLVSIDATAAAELHSPGRFIESSSIQYKLFICFLQKLVC